MTGARSKPVPPHGSNRRCSSPALPNAWRGRRISAGPRLFATATRPQTSTPSSRSRPSTPIAIARLTAPAAQLPRMVRTVPFTYRRGTALGRQGRAIGARLLRFGDPFVTGMWEITQGDDRGRSTALWRYVPGHHSDGVADLFFRFDFIVETNVGPARGILHDADRLTQSADAAIGRRGDMALPPFFQTIWLDQELAQVEEPATLQFLGLAYRPRREGRTVAT